VADERNLDERNLDEEVSQDDRTARAPSGAGTLMPSCEDAYASSSSDLEIGAPDIADIPRDVYAARLNDDSVLRRCGVAASTTVDICVAVQHGEIHGSTIRTSPRDLDAERCITNGLRQIRLPSHPKMDLVRTHFSGH
jgi:hypothetical protein